MNNKVVNLGRNLSDLKIDGFLSSVDLEKSLTKTTSSLKKELKFDFKKKL